MAQWTRVEAGWPCQQCSNTKRALDMLGVGAKGGGGDDGDAKRVGLSVVDDSNCESTVLL